MAATALVLTITPAGPHNIAGPGIPIRLQSDVSPPVGVGLQWNLSWFTVGGPTPAFHLDSFFHSGGLLDQVVVPYTVAISPTINVREGMPVTDDTVSLQVTLNRTDTGAAIDANSASLAWDAASGLANVTLMSPASTEGFTATDRAQLATAVTDAGSIKEAVTVPITTPTGVVETPLAQLLALPTLDALTLTEITAGPTPTFVGFSMPNNAVGLIIRILSTPTGQSPLTPDAGYYRPELGVANFFRGSDLVGRVGIHTVSRFIYPLPGAWAWWSSLILGGTLPPDYSVQVWLANEVTARVFFTALP